MGRGTKYSNLKALVGINQEYPSTVFQVENATCDGNAWRNASDVRLKKDIASSTYGLKEVLKLTPKFYVYKTDILNKREVGFIAQEVMQIMPEVVGGKEGDLENGETLTLSYGNLTAVLTSAIQEQQKEIEQLKQDVQDMKKLLKMRIRS